MNDLVSKAVEHFVNTNTKPFEVAFYFDGVEHKKSYQGVVFQSDIVDWLIRNGLTMNDEGEIALYDITEELSIRGFGIRRLNY